MSLPTVRHARRMHTVPRRNVPVVEPWLGHEHGIERVGQAEALERGLGSEPLLEDGCTLAWVVESTVMGGAFVAAAVGHGDEGS